MRLVMNNSFIRLICFYIFYIICLIEQSHSSVERAGILAGIRVRLLSTDDLLSLRGDILKSAMAEDTAKGLIPFFVYLKLLCYVENECC